jgi:hypothetical protein
MSQNFISIDAGSVDPAKLNAVCVRYLEYTQARSFRSTLIKRLLMLLGVVLGLTRGIHALPGVALLTAALLSGGGAAMAVAIEMIAGRKLARELRDVPREAH